MKQQKPDATDAAADTKGQNSEFFLGIGIVASIFALIAAIALIVYYNTPHTVYQPTKACDLLTKAKAQELLGNDVINSKKTEPEITKDTATSQCAYTDMNTDANAMKVAAIIVRSGVNDKGIEQNKNEFAAGRPKDNTETVKDLGDAAYYNKDLKLLNVLDGRNWLLVSYGAGAAPETNTIEQATELARKVLP